jgi:hypothetical protein
MTRYTARNGTTFLLAPETQHCVEVAGAADDGVIVSVDLDDLREFMQYLDDGEDSQAPNDADCAAVGPD